MRLFSSILALSSGLFLLKALAEEAGNSNAVQSGTVSRLTGFGGNAPAGQSTTTALDSKPASLFSQFLDMSLPRGIRNNNPGNVKKSGDNWQGKVQGVDQVFESFKTPEDGIRAAGKLLLNYQRNHGLNTLDAILRRYAPKTENNTRAYINAVSRSIGIAPNTPFDVAKALPKLLPAIIKHENGVQPYTQAQIETAIARI